MVPWLRGEYEEGWGQKSQIQIAVCRTEWGWVRNIKARRENKHSCCKSSAILSVHTFHCCHSCYFLLLSRGSKELHSNHLHNQSQRVNHVCLHELWITSPSSKCNCSQRVISILCPQPKGDSLHGRCWKCSFKLNTLVKKNSWLLFLNRDPQ